KVRRTRRAASRGPASTREKPPPGPTSVPVAAHSAVPWQTPFRDTSVTEGYDAKHVRRFQDRDTVEIGYVECSAGLSKTNSYPCKSVRRSSGSKVCEKAARKPRNPHLSSRSTRL